MFRKKDDISTSEPAATASTPSATGTTPLTAETAKSSDSAVSAVSSSGAVTTKSDPAKPMGAAAAQPVEKRLTVGKGIRLEGEITACDLLVVEGEVKVKLNDTKAVEIASDGRFEGSCEVDNAVISGVYEGDLVVRERLLIHADGNVKGSVLFGELEIERGGRIAGDVSMLDTSKSVQDQRSKSHAPSSMSSHGAQAAAAGD
ncbi:MAG: polymer-forming cytoskeletal protein [Geminicoccaceae bacterium]